MGQACRSWRRPASPRRVAHRGFDLVRILSADARANGHADVSNLFHGNEMIAIRAPYLEIAVLVLGITILLLETFAAKAAKKTFAYAGIVGLTAVLVASFFWNLRRSRQAASGTSTPQTRCRSSSNDSRS